MLENRNKSTNPTSYCQSCTKITVILVALFQMVQGRTLQLRNYCTA